jgi:hypothetical protein
MQHRWSSSPHRLVHALSHFASAGRTHAAAGTLRAVCLAATAYVAHACVLEDRNFDEDFAKERAADDDSDKNQTDDVVPNGNTLCDKYCREIMLACTGDNQIFPDDETCLSACKTLPERPPAGESVEGTNTVACRYQEVQDAKKEPPFYCSRAAIASEVCGDPCETYCVMQPKVCGEQPSAVVLEQEQCQRQCAGIPKTQTFSLTDNYSDDSIQCRLIHLVTASAKDPDIHCAHAKIDSPQVCGDNQPVSCENYCHTVSVACTGELQQYPSREVCEATCNALPAGTMKDRAAETVGCRIYHAYVALDKPRDHCSHAGPTTDGHCGSPGNSNCFNYCTLANAACGEQYAAVYGDIEECIDACLPLPGSAVDSEYPPVESADGGSKQVVQRLIRAATEVIAKRPQATCDDVFAL